jgi:DNA-binding HxlR family transcriptional regulator
MKRTSFASMDCSVAHTLEVVGEWWTMLIVREAFYGTRRFDDFQANLGIARNVLTVRLQRLVEHGVLERTLYQEHPPRYEYRLTDKGRDLFPVLLTLMKWGDRWAGHPEGPPVLVCDRETGEALEPVVVDARSGRPIDPRHTRPGAGPGASPPTRRRMEEWQQPTVRP